MKTTLEIISAASRVPECPPEAVKALMSRLNLNERAFALLMNVTPTTVRLWTSGAAEPCGQSMRLMQIYSICPEIVDSITDRQGEGQ